MANFDGVKYDKQFVNGSISKCDRLNNQMWETLVEVSWAIDSWKYNKPSPDDITRISKKLRDVIDSLNKQSEELTYIEGFINLV